MASTLALACPSVVRADPLTVEIVLGLESVKRALDGKPPKKVIVVPDRIATIVV